MRQDLIYAVRALARNPLFSSVAIVTVALGVGLNTSVFGIVNVLLFRPPPAENAHELVWLSSASVKPNGPRGNMTYPDVDDMRSLPVFRGVMAYGEVQANVAAEGRAERLDGHIVSGDYFLVLGTKAYRGRLVASEDDTPGNTVAVISFRLWQRVFGGRNEAVGTSIRINGAHFTICGVAPPGFKGPDVFSTADVWVPLAASAPMNSAVRTPVSRTTWWLKSIGRLASGVSRPEAGAAVSARAAAIAQAYPGSHEGFTVRLESFWWRHTWQSKGGETSRGDSVGSDDDRPVHRVRQCRQPPPRAWCRKRARDSHSCCSRCIARRTSSVNT